MTPQEIATQLVSAVPERQAVIDYAAHRLLALELALELACLNMVLLKNDGLLPLAPTVQRTAVIGPIADSVRALEGNYDGTASRATTALAGQRRQFPREFTGRVGFDLLAQGGEEIEVCVAEQLPGEWSPGGPAADARVARHPQLGLDAQVTRR
jgi:beta-glucosidase-like glycosyl hydrolase